MVFFAFMTDEALELVLALFKTMPCAPARARPLWLKDLHNLRAKQ